MSSDTEASVLLDDDDVEPFDAPPSPQERASVAMRARLAARRHRSKRTIRKCAFVVANAVALAMITGGCVAVSRVDSFVAHAYAPTVCRIVADHSLESTCAYYKVSLSTHEPGTDASAVEEACAVPANVARAARPGHAVACNNDVAADERARYANATEVPCFAPRSRAYLVTAERCSAAATSRGALADLYHARYDDFVYLGSRVEGREALYAASASARELGGWLIAGGVLAAAATWWAECWTAINDYCAHTAERDEHLATTRRMRGPPKRATD